MRDSIVKENMDFSEIHQKMEQMHKIALYATTSFVPWTFCIGPLGGLALSEKMPTFSLQTAALLSFIPVSAALMITAKYGFDRSEKYAKMLENLQEKEAPQKIAQQSPALTQVIQSQKTHCR